MTIRVKIYIDGELKKVFTDDLSEEQCIGLQNTIIHHVSGMELASYRGGVWSREVKWEVEVLR